MAAISQSVRTGRLIPMNEATKPKYKDGQKVWLKADKKEGWKREKVTILGYQGPKYDGMYDIEDQNGECLEVHQDNIEGPA